MLWGITTFVMSWLVFVVFFEQCGRLKLEPRRGGGNDGGHQHWVPSETICSSVTFCKMWRLKGSCWVFYNNKKGHINSLFLGHGGILNRPTSEDHRVQRQEASTFKISEDCKPLEICTGKDLTNSGLLKNVCEFCMIFSIRDRPKVYQVSHHHWRLPWWLLKTHSLDVKMVLRPAEIFMALTWMSTRQVCWVSSVVCSEMLGVVGIWKKFPASRVRFFFVFFGKCCDSIPN